ncbi:MAG: FlgD immunoglobulin-like domain containing protein [bacterium]
MTSRWLAVTAVSLAVIGLPHGAAAEWWPGFAPPPTGKGLDNYANDLVVYDGGLYVCGMFTQAGHTSAHYVARWDGAHWQGFIDGPDYWVWALLPNAGDLWAGGAFQHAVRLALGRETSGPVAFRIYDVMGRLVTRLEARMDGEGNARAAWNGLDAAGRRVTAGVYFVRSEDLAGAPGSMRLVRVE